MISPDRHSPSPRRPFADSTGSAGAVALLALLALVVVVLVAILESRRREGEGAEADGEFAYDLSSLLEVDPALLVAKPVLDFPTGLAEVRALAAWSPEAVAVAGDEMIRFFDDEGRPAGDAALEGEPWCLALGLAGEGYIGYRTHIEVVDAKTRERRARWSALGAQALLTALAAGPADIYAADSGQRMVWRLGLDGRVLGQIGKRDAERDVEGFILPSPHLDLAIAPDGGLWISNPGRHRLEAWTPEGRLESTWGKASLSIDGFSGCCNPSSFAILADGGVVTGEKGLPRAKLYDAHGAFLGVVAPPREFAAGERALGADWTDGSGGGALDVAVDARGRILVLDPLRKNVRIYARTR